MHVKSGQTQFHMAPARSGPQQPVSCRTAPSAAQSRRRGRTAPRAHARRNHGNQGHRRPDPPGGGRHAGGDGAQALRDAPGRLALGDGRDRTRDRHGQAHLRDLRRAAGALLRHAAELLLPVLQHAHARARPARHRGRRLPEPGLLPLLLRPRGLHRHRRHHGRVHRGHGADGGRGPRHLARRGGVPHGDAPAPPQALARGGR